MKGRKLENGTVGIFHRGIRVALVSFLQDKLCQQLVGRSQSYFEFYRMKLSTVQKFISYSIPSVRISCNHSESIRRSYLSGKITVAVLQARSVVACSSEVIRSRTSELHYFKLVIGVVMVKLRNPIVAVIFSLVASGESCILRREFF